MSIKKEYWEWLDVAMATLPTQSIHERSRCLKKATAVVSKLEMREFAEVAADRYIGAFRPSMPRFTRP
jgi:hypothetical protein